MDENKITTFSRKDNIIYTLLLYKKYGFSAIGIIAALIPTSLGIQFLNIYLPGQIVEIVSSQEDIKKMLGIVLAVILFLGILETLSNIMTHYKACILGHIRYGVDMEIKEAELNVAYSDLESKQFQNLLRESIYCTQQWGGKVILFSSVENLGLFIQGIAGYILFGGMISLIHPIIALILTITPFIPYLLARRFQKFEFENRENWTFIERVQWYIAVTAGKFECGKDIRLYSMANWFLSIYRDMSEARKVWDRKLTRKKITVDFSELLIILLRDGVSYLILLNSVWTGKISAGMFVMLFAAVNSFSNRVNEIAKSFGEINSDCLRMNSLHNLLKYEREKKRGHNLDSSSLSIRFENVSFHYNEAEEKTLKDICLTVKKGEKIALVGKNGAGKTTLIKLLCGLYQPTDGSIFIEENSQNDFSRNEWYHFFSCVFQEINILPYTIAEIISTLPLEKTDLKRVMECVELAGLQDKITSLQHGLYTKYNKQLNEDGVELSGGEQQKLLLARAIYRDAPILILDEPTAALDPLAEEEMYQKYNELVGEHTSIFISHRLTSTRFCDRIILLEQGEIVEIGTHDELMKLKGKYAEMYLIQAKYYGKDIVKEKVGEDEEI